LIEKPNNEYYITYSNSFLFEGELFSFRKKELFNITKLPIFIPFNNSSNSWVFKRKQLTISKAKKIIIIKKVTIDVSELQWYIQINLDAVFNINYKNNKITL